MELKVENLIKSFEEKRVIKGADYSFEKGKIYGLLGRNGAGKTTLFNCISGEMDFDSGKIYMTDEENSESMNYEKIGYVYSTPILPEFLTGYEFIRFFTDINKKKIKNIKTPEEYADMVCFDRSDLDKLIKGYSHGMKNKMQMLSAESDEDTENIDMWSADAGLYEQNLSDDKNKNEKDNLMTDGNTENHTQSDSRTDDYDPYDFD